VTDFDWNLAEVPGGVFLVRDETSGEGRSLTAHTFGISPPAKRELEKAFRVGSGRRLRVVRHQAKSVHATRSLAALDRRFAGGAIVYDPTAIFTRMAEVIRCADALRAELGSRVKSVLLDSTRRTLYVVLEHKAFQGKGLAFRAQAAEAMATCAKTVSDWKLNAPAEFELAVRIGFEPPSGLRLVAVDARSEPSRYLGGLKKVASQLRSAAGALAVGAIAIGAPSAALADDAAAVADPNFTVQGRLGWESNDGLHHDLFRTDVSLEGAVPLGENFGVQGEAATGVNNYYGAGGHLFWRDPSWGLLGGFASYESLESVKMGRYGGEAEFYLNSITLSARGGYENGDVDHGGFIRGDVSFYATPSFVIRAGFEGVPHQDFGRAGLEFQPAPESMSGLSLYVDSTFGQGTGIFAGFKFHFGEEGQSIMWRDRHEDPSNSLFNRMPVRHAHYGMSG
jgi:hypothetical protein